MQTGDPRFESCWAHRPKPRGSLDWKQVTRDRPRAGQRACPTLGPPSLSLSRSEHSSSTATTSMTIARRPDSGTTTSALRWIPGRPAETGWVVRAPARLPSRPGREYGHITECTTACPATMRSARNSEAERARRQPSLVSRYSGPNQSTAWTSDAEPPKPTIRFGGPSRSSGGHAAAKLAAIPAALHRPCQPDSRYRPRTPDGGAHDPVHLLDLVGARNWHTLCTCRPYA